MADMTGLASADHGPATTGPATTGPAISGLDVVALGEALLRLSSPEGVPLDAVDTLALNVAGSELNVMVALASLGLRTGLISALPDGPLGRRVLRELRAVGVDVSRIHTVPGARLGTFYVESGVGARPSRVYYDRAGSAFCSIGEPGQDPLGGAGLAVLSGITPALGPGPASAASEFAQTCAATDATLCFDVNYRQRLWDTTDAAAGVAGLLAVADIAVCAEADARRVLGCTGEPTDLVAEIAARWAGRADWVVLTMGANGAVARDRTGSVVRQAAIPTRELDGFGAGDAFLAGLMWSRHGGGDLPSAMRAAVTLGALACTVRGDQIRCTPDELAALVASNELPPGEQVDR